MDKSLKLRNNFVDVSTMLRSFRPPGADEFWLYLTFENPIYFCLMKYFTLSDLLKLVFSSPIIGRFLQSKMPVLARLRNCRGGLLDFTSFLGQMPNFSDAGLLIRLLRPYRVKIPDLGPLDTPYFLEIFQKSTVRNLDVTINRSSQFLVRFVRFESLTVRQSESGCCFGVYSLLTSVPELKFLELRGCDIHHVEALRIGSSPFLRVFRLIDPPSLCYEDDFLFGHFSRIPNLRSLTFTHLGVPNFDWHLLRGVYHSLILLFRPLFCRLESLEISICEHVEFTLLLELASLRVFVLHLYYRIDQQAINKLCEYLRQVRRVQVTVKVFEMHGRSWSVTADDNLDVCWYRFRDQLLDSCPSLVFVPFCRNSEHRARLFMNFNYLNLP